MSVGAILGSSFAPSAGDVEAMANSAESSKSALKIASAMINPDASNPGNIKQVNDTGVRFAERAVNEKGGNVNRLV